MAAARAHRQVVPYIRVVFEEVLESLGQAQLAAAVESRSAEGGDQCGHRRVASGSDAKHLCADRDEMNLGGWQYSSAGLLGATAGGAQALGNLDGHSQHLMACRNRPMGAYGAGVFTISALPEQPDSARNKELDGR